MRWDSAIGLLVCKRFVSENMIKYEITKKPVLERRLGI
jgi:hypothetical protein